MLAYAFWHWPRPGLDPAAYEQDLAVFHQALASARPPGFLESAVFRVEGAPWIDAGAGYEDWYLIEGAWALDELNSAAVSGACRAPHDRVARAAAGGTAGLYELRRGRDRADQVRTGLWIEKPAGMAYEDLYADLEHATEREGVGLWGRQMVLGPTPEFSLRAPSEPQLPDEFEAFHCSLELVWHTPGSGHS